MTDQLQHIYESTYLLIPEAIIIASLLINIVLGLILNTNKHVILKTFAFLTYGLALFVIIFRMPDSSISILGGMLHIDPFSTYFKVLTLIGGILGVWMYDPLHKKNSAEYFLLLHAVILGSCLLASSVNFILILLSLELISLSSYLLAGFGFNKNSAEGSLKYFLFGTVATACTIYGLSILYGLAGTLDLSSELFVKNLMEHSSPLLLIGGALTFAGLLFKIAAAPFHLWAPDMYESAPTPVVAFISVVPKLAGIALITRFTQAIHLFGQSGYNWQMILAGVSMISILIGNLSALLQKSPKRMLAYSSVAQAGFLLVGLVAFSLEGIHFMLFYSAIFLAMNFLVFHTINQFENALGQLNVTSFAGLGAVSLIPSLSMLVGLLSLTGLPPTAGFTAKFFIFTSLWGSYQQHGDLWLLFLLIIGLLNTVVSLFFYLKIPYYLFIKQKDRALDPIKTDLKGNLLSLILVIVLFYLFISPGGLMGWINKITFVL